MTYVEARKKIESTPQFSSTATLKRITELLKLLRNPETPLKIIHVAGTNGKGSMATMTAKVLEEHGYKTGLFLSPYVVTFRERISINGEWISEEDFASFSKRVFSAAEQLSDPPNFFELMTALALLYFAEKTCDFVVLEVGMGGRLDATNAISAPLVSVITPISLDHTKYLGETRAEIAKEKCGIIKPGCIAVSSLSQTPEALSVIQEDCKEKGVSLLLPSAPRAVFCSLFGTEFTYSGKNYALRLLGKHQADNACTVLAVCDALKKQGVSLCDDLIRAGLSKATLPARLELLSDSPICLLDGGHNPDGIEKLLSFVAENRTKGKLICVFGCLKDKGFSEMCEMVAQKSDVLITTPCPSPRTCFPNDLAPHLTACEEVYQAESCLNAVKKARTLADENDMILICGSLYLASEVKNLSLRQKI
ncbi:MAG: bifunctional folylpolyglutamate synthase/dihydrofolate synthase [Ruminococcaceae bacterium]|nr:bifunctional folylpolyglutamate synthase/dihydrofolate synthase [Oscillospiraceae bacterium]